MAVGDVHIAGPDGWALCGSPGPLRGYNATSRACTDCDQLEADRQRGVAAALAAKPQPRTFRVINGDNGYGLSRDRDIVSDAFFAAGWTARCDGNVAVNVHLERVNTRALSTARYNVVIPNPEWWLHVGNVSVAEMDAACREPTVRVWAKTRDTERIFRLSGANVEYVGFRSNDRHYPLIPRERTFLHVAGEGPNKRTERLVFMWRSEWPLLTVTCSPRIASMLGPRSNVQIISHRMDDGELRALQNRCAFHIYPSRYEGFGHAQWEGLSCGALVFVCDGPPFDEHDVFCRIDSEPYGSPDFNPHIVWRDVKEVALAEAVGWAQSLSDEVLSAKRTTVRQAWERETDAFSIRIHESIKFLDDMEMP